MALSVLKHISGSHCVVQKCHPDGYSDQYIDARKHREGLTHIEVVRRGHVFHEEFAFNRDAPARIIELAKEHLA